MGRKMRRLIFEEHTGFMTLDIDLHLLSNKGDCKEHNLGSHVLQISAPNRETRGLQHRVRPIDMQERAARQKKCLEPGVARGECKTKKRAKLWAIDISPWLFGDTLCCQVRRNGPSYNRRSKDS